MDGKKNMNSQRNIIRLTIGPKHHFFGFHDLPTWNFDDNKILCLEVDKINRPPLLGEKAGVGYIDENGIYKKIGYTEAYNFPQGARMQWIGKSNKFIVNNVHNNSFVSDIYDAEINKMIATYDFPCHQITKNGIFAFFINYSRLYRLGAYGYQGVEDFTKSEPVPTNDGIYIGDLKNNKKELLISIRDVANFPEKFQNESFGHHYLTHLLLNPSNNRIAFLHRYPLPDGGEITRLMTIGADGSDLRCLATGFLSHFDWKDDDTIFIYGRPNNSIEILRSMAIFSFPFIKNVANIGKRIVRIVLRNKISNKNGFYLIKDENEQNYTKVAENILTEDGHPMFCPTNRDWIINDTYPNKEGKRTLMLYSFSQNLRIDLGQFKMIFEKPDLTDSLSYFQEVDREKLKTIGVKNLAFTRSGLHCDLHPRWNMQGDKIAFDSIHEGSRQLYMINVSNFIR